MQTILYQFIDPFNPFHAIGLFPYPPLKTSENQMLSYVFRGYKKAKAIKWVRSPQNLFYVGVILVLYLIVGNCMFLSTLCLANCYKMFRPKSLLLNSNWLPVSVKSIRFERAMIWIELLCQSFKGKCG